MDENERLQVSRWGFQWGRYDKYMDIHREQLSRWLGPGGDDAFRDFLGKSVLDVGCGMGRNSLTLLKAGAGSVVGIDGDPQCAALAERNLREFSAKSRFLQCDVYDLEEAANGKTLGTFERVICIGVLHHLAEPAKALRAIYSRLAGGGKAYVWVYGNQSSLVVPINLVRELLKPFRGRIRVLHSFAGLIATLVKGLIHLRILRGDYWELLGTSTFNHIREIVLDQLHPDIANYWSEAELKTIIEGSGIKQFEINEVNEISWVAILQRN